MNSEKRAWVAPEKIRVRVECVRCNVKRLFQGPKALELLKLFRAEHKESRATSNIWANS